MRSKLDTSAIEKADKRAKKGLWRDVNKRIDMIGKKKKKKYMRKPASDKKMKMKTKGY